MKLSDTFGPNEAASDIAAAGHATWEDAVAGYLARRRRLLLQGITTKASFEAERVRDRLKILLEVGKTLGAEMERIDPAAEEAIQKTQQMSREDHQLALAYLLTPLGWRTKYMPAIEKRRQLALAEWEEGTNPDSNLALAAELEELQKFLGAVESDAHLIQGQRNREALVGTQPQSLDSIRRSMM